jgi:putative acyl-CoA dehydrogenase
MRMIAATAVALRLARAYDDPGAAALRRFATAVMKYWICKRAPGHAAEALECLGGNGYVEDSGLPRLYRDSPLNSIWEGSGNVAALDVLRAIGRDPEGAEAFVDECALAAGADRRLDGHLASVRARLDAVRLAEPQDAQFGARTLAQELALALQGALLVRHAPPAVADAFCAGRLERGAGGARVYGTLPGGVDARAIVDRALPV